MKRAHSDLAENGDKEGPFPKRRRSRSLSSSNEVKQLDADLLPPPKRPPPTGHELDRMNHHISLKHFGKELQKAASIIFPGDGKKASRYTRFDVILLSWEDEDPNLPVSLEVDKLADAFADYYGYNVEKWRIPSENCHNQLQAKILEFLGANDPNHLKIVYYGGHGRLTNHGQPAWTSLQNKGNDRCPTVKWSGIQNTLEESRSDVLILLDCCASGVCTSDEGNGVTELIAACAYNAVANGVGRYSFSYALNLKLRQLSRLPCYNIGHLYNAIFSEVQSWKLEDSRYIKAPVHLVLSQNHDLPRSIRLSRAKSAAARSTESNLEMMHSQSAEPVQNDLHELPSSPVNVFSNMEHTAISEDSGSSSPPSPIASLSQLPDYPRLLFSIRLSEDVQAGDLSTELFADWLRSVPVSARLVTVEAGFASNSTITLVSVPAALLAYLAPDPAILLLGTIHSRNLMSEHHKKEDVLFVQAHDTSSTAVEPGTPYLFAPYLELLAGSDLQQTLKGDVIEKDVVLQIVRPNPYWTANQASLEVLRGSHGYLQFEKEEATVAVKLVSEGHRENGLQWMDTSSTTAQPRTPLPASPRPQPLASSIVQQTSRSDVIRSQVEEWPSPAPWSPVFGADASPEHARASVRTFPPHRNFPDKLEDELDQQLSGPGKIKTGQHQDVPAENPRMTTDRIPASHGGMEKQLTEGEHRFLIAEAFKKSAISPETLSSLLVENNILPDWDNMLLPIGRDLAQCKHAFESLKPTRASDQVASAPPPCPTPIITRSFLPTPRSSTGSQSRATMASSKKRGRPSKADVERRQREAIERGDVVPYHPRTSQAGKQELDEGKPGSMPAVILPAPITAAPSLEKSADHSPGANSESPTLTRNLLLKPTDSRDSQMPTMTSSPATQPKKRGRPSKADVERRQREAIERGLIIPPAPTMSLAGLQGQDDDGVMVLPGPPTVTRSSQKGANYGSDASRETSTLARNILPKPASSEGSRAPTMTFSPASTSQKKRGRPSRADAERRQREARERGNFLPPSRPMSPEISW